ncbi:MAG: PTS sugar transporter subunit IID, partial [Acidobacteria bacterium]
IWIPPILASAILGPLVTTIFPMTNIPIGAGMGTSGLVGQFGTLTAMGARPATFIQIALFHFLLPAILPLVFSEYMRKKGLIQPGDMALPQTQSQKS